MVGAMSLIDSLSWSMARRRGYIVNWIQISTSATRGEICGFPGEVVGFRFHVPTGRKAASSHDRPLVQDSRRLRDIERCHRLVAFGKKEKKIIDLSETCGKRILNFSSSRPSFDVIT